MTEGKSYCLEAGCKTGFVIALRSPVGDEAAASTITEGTCSGMY